MVLLIKNDGRNIDMINDTIISIFAYFKNLDALFCEHKRIFLT